MQLADVLTESLSADDFGPLDLSLSSMTGATADSRGLDESDFLNPTALSDPEGKTVINKSKVETTLINISLFA